MKPKKIICQKQKDSIKIIFDNNEEYIISAELLRVESPSAEVQGHGYNQKQIIKGKQNVLINDIKPVGNYAIRIIFNDGHETGIYSWSLLYNYAKNHKKIIEKYYKHLND